MKFSMIFEAQVEYGTPDVERQTIRNCVEQAVYAEEVGFDGVWAVEHHTLMEYSHMSAPEIFLTAVAAKTSRIRVGHAAVCMPFGYNHPARVAERAAMLDIISDGRLNLGAARGGTTMEMSLCGVQPEDTKPQVEEALRFLGHCWREDTIEWDSELLQIHSARGPTEAHRGPASGADAAPAVVPRVHEPRHGAYRGALRRRPDGPRVRWARDDRRDEAQLRRRVRATRRGRRRVARPDQRRVRRAVPDVPHGRPRGGAAHRCACAAVLRRGDHATGPRPTASLPRATPTRSTTSRSCRSTTQAALDAVARGEAPPTAASSMYNLDHALGDAETAIDYVKRLEAVGVDNCMCLIQMGTLTQDQQLETIRIFGEQVIPAFR